MNYFSKFSGNLTELSMPVYAVVGDESSGIGVIASSRLLEKSIVSLLRPLFCVPFDVNKKQ